jgi:hypothetical protein
MKKTQAAWIVLGLGAGLLLFAFSSAAAAALTITLGAGLMSGIKTPSSGRVVLQLPAGATWIAGQASSGMLSPRALPVPGGEASALAIDVSPGLSVALQWHDANGTAQNTFLTFA